jgi:hypothetical protein
MIQYKEAYNPRIVAAQKSNQNRAGKGARVPGISLKITKKG